jgi:hypothetical protein
VAPPAAGGSATESPDFDPGGGSTYLPDAPPEPQVAAPAAPDNDDVGPLDQEPATDSAPVAPEDVGSAPPPVGTQPTPPPAPTPPNAAIREETPEPSASPVPPEPEDPSSIADDEPEPGSGAEEPSTDVPDADGDRSQGTHGRTDESSRKSQERRARVRTNEATAPAPASAPATTTAPTTPTTTAPTAPAATPTAARAGETPTAQSVAVATRSAGRNRAKPGDKTHAVRAGESLWTIAADHLGGRASVARVAREVNRLWTLNEDRIGTGDPDLLRVGTQLRLR